MARNCGLFAHVVVILVVVAVGGCAPTTSPSSSRLEVEDLVEGGDFQRTVRLGNPNEEIPLPPRAFVEAPTSDGCELGARRALDGTHPDGVSFADYEADCYWIGGEATDVIGFIVSKFEAAEYVFLNEFGDPDSGAFWQLWVRAGTNCVVMARFIYSVDGTVLLQTASQVTQCSTFSDTG